MNYKETRRRIWTMRIVGLLLMAVGSVFTLVSLLKLLYFRLPQQGGELTYTLNALVQETVQKIYEKTEIINYIWTLAPIPTLEELFSSSNVVFIALYMLIFVGSVVMNYAKRLAAQLKNAVQIIREEMLRQSVRDGQSLDVAKTINIPKNIDIHLPQQESLLKNIHGLYIAPIIVLIVGSVFLASLGVI